MDLTTLILSVITTFILIKIIHLFYNNYLLFKKINKIPSPKTKIPLIGWTFEVVSVKVEERNKWFHNISRQFEDGLFYTWLGSFSVHLNKPQHAEIILRHTKQINKSFFYKFLEPWLGFGLLNSTGQKWAHDRKLITPAFHFGILEEFSEIMVEKAAILNEKLKAKVKLNGDDYFDVFDMIGKCALDIIYETALGMNVHAQDDVENEYIKAVHTISTNAVARAMRLWLKSDFIFYKTSRGKAFKEAVEIAHDKCNKVIIHKQQERKLKCNQDNSSLDVANDIGKKKRRAFLDSLLEASEKSERPLTMDEIREQVNTFMFAGHDTTSALISWTLFCLGNDDEIQKNVHEEIDDVFGDSEELTNTKDLAELKYLDRVIKEVLRLYPSAPTISRKLTEDLQFGKYTVPAGCNLNLHIYQLHLDPDIWPNPKKFDPDRFLDSNKRHPYAYVPFSAGPRNCIGQKYAQLEAKMVLTEILRKWKVKSRDTHETMKSYTAVILRPCEGLYLKFEDRKKNKVT
ncbi:hypothetical protein HCN44_004302 [Aphidius gifuensis]|uniref:Cytochrome P450 n=2 Tax=Aphidius gifuensis TaxID=684658 RepID=A0A834XWL5_APHGI|nr:hypothetical protein HCN44_004302 [Aphidius gifuensis]